MRFITAIGVGLLLITGCAVSNGDNLTAATDPFAASNEDLNGAKGKVFNVNEQHKTFELLKETVIDPKTNEGRSRHTVSWTEKTEFWKVVPHKSFKDIEGKHLVEFYNLNDKWIEEIKAGRLFKDRYVRILPETDKPHGLSEDKRIIVGWFTPDKSDKRHKEGDLAFNGKKIRASLLGPNGAVDVYSKATAEDLAEGFWEAKIWGQRDNGKFIVSRMEITPLLDPRTVDDPKLPRILVIGDSISMNYHAAAKEALDGIANYYRCEGNGGPSDRGVVCAELWLGDYTKNGLQWDVIQFNHGLHDLKQLYNEETGKYTKHQVSLEDYKANLDKEIQILKKTGARLVWCPTTPVPQSSVGVWGGVTMGRQKDEDLVFNKAAMEVISKYPEIKINDINTFIRESSAFDKWRQQKDVHFWDHNLAKLVGEAVADGLKKVLADENKSK